MFEYSLGYTYRSKNKTIIDYIILYTKQKNLISKD